MYTMSLLEASMVFLIFLFAYQQRVSCKDSIDMESSTETFAEIGETKQAECIHTRETKVFWKVNGRKVPSEKCKKCSIWYEASELSTTIFITPFDVNDFGKYECVNQKSLDVLGKFRLSESINKGKRQCLLDIQHSKNPKSTMPTPFCDEDGYFEEVQTEIRENGKQAFWCVDKFSGKKITDNTYQLSKLRCAQKGWSPTIAIIILLFIQIGFVLFDVFLYVCYQEGFIAKFMVLKEERDNSRYKAVPGSQPEEFGTMK